MEKKMRQPRPSRAPNRIRPLQDLRITSRIRRRLAERLRDELDPLVHEFVDVVELAVEVPGVLLAVGGPSLLVEEDAVLFRREELLDQAVSRYVAFGVGLGSEEEVVVPADAVVEEPSPVALEVPAEGE